MKASRVIVASGTTAAQTFVCDPELAIIAESPEEADRLVTVFRNLFLGVKRGSQVFATIDDIEFEMTNDMMPLVGQRLARQFDVVDLALPPVISAESTDARDLHAAVARAALETSGAIVPTLDLERIDQATVAVDRAREPLAQAAHAAFLRRTGIFQLFSRRSGRDLLDPNNPTVSQLARFDQVLADRRRQITAEADPLPYESANATAMLRELVSSRMGGLASESAAAMTPEAIERDVAHWVAQQHDRQMTPLLAEICARHAKGIDVLGPIPVILDLRRVHGLPPGGDAIRWAARSYGDDLQFIVLVSNDENRRWIESAITVSKVS